MKKSMTITEIAKEAGVSKSTVSRVLNNKTDVLPDTKERVLRVIRAHQFQPNAYARSMSQRRSRTIGVVVPHDIDYVFQNQYYMEIQRGVLKALTKRGYYALILCCRDMKKAFDAVLQKRVDGLLVISPLYEHTPQINELLENHVPLVLVGKAPASQKVYQVCVDNYVGASAAMRHLFELGHERIAYINGPHFLPSSEERRRAYLDAMARQGYPVLPGMVQEGYNSIDSGYQTASRIMDAFPDVTAIFVASDYMAIGVMDAIHDRGLDIPGDISVVGFDNIQMSEQVTPALTTVCQQIEEKGRVSVNLLLDLIEEVETPEKPVVELEAKLLARASTGPVSVKTAKKC
ncbi:MAG: LacI family DNA-binding transcriptional regulator [Agathobaculum sp.]|uniref:LacI family DNA-binding transcriptional regulator n=1 Tax=Agathobaculum sp. TaxID=2048138 RepID=UPI003D92D9D3